MTRAFVVACGRWVEVDVERVREAVKAGAVFETLIAPVIKDCVWGEIEWHDGVLTGLERDVAEQRSLMRSFSTDQNKHGVTAGPGQGSF